MLDSVTHNIPDVSSPSAEIGWLQLDASGNVLTANDAAASILGYRDALDLVTRRRVLTELSGNAFALSSPASGRNRWRPAIVKDAQDNWICVYACRTGAVDDKPGILIVGGAPADWFPAPHQVAAGFDLSLLELSQSGIFIKSTDCQLLYVNRAQADMLGYEPLEMTGMNGGDIIDREDLPRVSEVLCGRPWRAGEMREVQVRMRMKDDVGVRHVVIRQGQITHEGRAAFIGTVRDVTDLHRGEQALKDYAKRLRRLSQQVLDVQENERRNLARELHDEIGQQLTLLKLSLAQVAATDKSHAATGEALDAVSALLRQVRDLSLDLRPSMLDDLGLGATLRWYVGRAARLATLETRIEIDPQFPRLSSTAETLFFRVAQEAVTNVIRHAGARCLTLQLTQRDDCIELRVVDDGRGFDLEAARAAGVRGHSAGLLGMQERAALAEAELMLTSSTDTGTTLRLIMPAERAVIST